GHYLYSISSWPAMSSGVAPVDTDGDGMPDSWELDHGLNPNVADGNADRDGDGYTNIEEYINSFFSVKKPPVTPTSTPTAVITETPTTTPTATFTPTSTPVVTITPECHFFNNIQRSVCVP
ncbi:MAG TPA: hypothetical protein VIY48_16465, partial [Candidatus Paceibacterota bacterium]